MLVTKRRVKFAKLPNVTLTLKLVEALALFPALSVAVAENVCDPSPKTYASPSMSAQVSDAIPDSASVAVQVIDTC